MIRLYIYILLLLLSCLSYVFYEISWKNTEHQELILNAICAALFGSIGILFNYFSTNWGAVTLALKCLYNRNDSVYVSLSYLFKIKIAGENKYLMIKGSKLKHQYQPIGGVYKKYNSLTEKWQKWGALEAKNDRNNVDDLRFYVKRKYIPEIREWFYKRKNREIDVWREFCEELIAPKILDANIFNHIKPEFLYSKEEALIQRKGIKTKQFLIYDIYNVNFSKVQEEAIFSLYQKGEITEQYAFVDEENLDKELFTINNQEYQLGFHAKYLKNE